MTYLPRVAAATEAEWPDLAVELDRWEEAGRSAGLWWRDDDAVASTPQLDRLLRLAGGVPLALSVIPADARASLARALDPFPQVAVLHHGWCHANRATSGKKSEYPAERHPVDVADELDEGRKQLRALFGARALPVFVPPWNRFADRFLPLLAEAGLIAISQQAPRKVPLPEGIAAIDVQLDVTDWHGDCGFVGDGPALARLLAELRRRREDWDGGAIGILTHHLVMDAATEDFLGRLGEMVAWHPGARWLGGHELLAPR
ncbi:MAG TPA: polysaccharide deacetylase family protein [Stellaceae bacterium]|nr:polysaccharide deacetylase family protein [Stellaceae bacterium]